MGLKEKLALEVEKSRKNLLTMIILTGVNLILIALEASISFPFSASLPQIFLVIGRMYTYESGASIFAIVGIALAVISICIYGLFYFLSKKRSGFLIAALVIFLVDTGIMFWMFSSSFDSSMVIDVVFHLWVIWTLISGIRAASSLKKLPEDEELVEEIKEDEFQME